MKLRLAIALGVIFLLCSWIAGACGRGLACDQWLLGTSSGFVMWSALGLLIVHLAAWSGLAALRVIGASRDFSRLPRALPSRHLESAGRRVGAGRLTYLDTVAPLAFCMGLFRPAIVISRGTVDSLSPAALAAVLAHEAHHQRHFEPIRRALRSAAASVWFYLPLVGWWASRREEASELAADRHAIRLVGRPALARALLADTRPTRAWSAAGFAGSLAPRVAQLLGDPIPPRRADRRLVGATLAGLLASLVLGVCVLQLASTVFAAG